MNTILKRAKYQRQNSRVPQANPVISEHNQTLPLNPTSFRFPNTKKAYPDIPRYSDVEDGIQYYQHPSTRITENDPHSFTHSFLDQEPMNCWKTLIKLLDSSTDGISVFWTPPLMEFQFSGIQLNVTEYPKVIIKLERSCKWLLNLTRCIHISVSVD